MMTKLKSSKTAALKLSMGILVTVALLVIFAFDNENYQIQEKKSPAKQAKVIATDQQKSTQTEEPVFGDPELPSFQGGDVTKFKKWVQDNLKYPPNAKEKGISGKVYVQYIINSNGEVVDVKVVRSAEPSLDAEAIRVVSSSPKWEPATDHGIKVKMQFTMPVLFANNPQKPAQTNEKAPGEVEQMPVFPGGEKAFAEFIGKEVKYPEVAKKEGTQGKVYISFLIDKEGNVVNPKIAKGVTLSLDEEALRVIKSMPKWIPGKDKGKNVDVQLTIPIAFVLN